MMMRSIRYLAVCAALLTQVGVAQADPVSTARAYREAHAARILNDFADFLRIPNHAHDAENIRRNADYLVKAFGDRGFKMEILELPDAAPMVYGVRSVPGADRTIVIYVHYDGQPVDPAAWRHPPFEPTLYSRAFEAGGKPIPFPKAGEPIDPDWRIYARSAADDKAPFPALMAVLDAFKENEIALSSNIKLVFDGEEEVGSPNLGAFLDAHADKFSDVDLWLFCDGPGHQSGRPQITFGVRGVTGLDVTVYGANRALHSGHYGNWAPVPGTLMSSLLASMKDETGQVLIKDFYNDTAPLTKADRDAIAAMPPIDAELRQTYGLAQSEANNAPFAERLMIPALIIRGIRTGAVGAEAKNAIPATAAATLGIRLALGDDPDLMKDRVEAHIRAQGYHIVREEPDEATRLVYPKIAKVNRRGGYRAVRTRLDDGRVAGLTKAIQSVHPDVVLNPTMGGSLPLYMFTDRSEAPFVILPIANFDNNQHAPNENIRVGNLWYGVDVYAAVLTMP